MRMSDWRSDVCSSDLVLSSGVAADLRQPLMFGALVLWLGGGALYLWLMPLLFFRYTFLPMSAAELTPPYWINMGAVAISTLAGATLLDQAALAPLVERGRASGRARVGQNGEK